MQRQSVFHAACALGFAIALGVALGSIQPSAQGRDDGFTFALIGDLG